MYCSSLKFNFYCFKGIKKSPWASFSYFPLFIWSANWRRHTMRNRQGLLLFVLWQQGDITPENRPPLPGKSPTPSVRGDLINCFSTLLLVGQKKIFFLYFWQCPIFSSSPLRVVHSQFVRYFVFLLFFIAIYIYFYVFIIWSAFGVLSSAKLRHFMGWPGCF